MFKIITTFYDIDASNFEALIKKLELQLFTNNYIEKSFGKNIIKREKIYPTGLSFDNINIAIPHTDAIHVKTTGIIPIKLKKPIKMIHMATADQVILVQYIFLLLIKESEKQIDFLTDLMKKFQSHDFIVNLKAITNSKDLKNIFK